MKTLLILKPGFAKKRILDETITALERKGLQVTARYYHVMTEDEAERFYAVHRGKEFYKRLIQYMTSGLSIMLEVSSMDPEIDVVSLVRELVGATDPTKAAEGTLRKLYGEDTTRNGFHSSDSPNSAIFELGMFFN